MQYSVVCVCGVFDANQLGFAPQLIHDLQLCPPWHAMHAALHLDLNQLLG